MGQTCFKSSISYNLPTKVRVSLDDSDVEEDLAIIPETIEALEQAVSPLISRHLQLSRSDFIILTYQKSATVSLRLTSHKQWKALLKASRGKELTICVSKGSYASAFDLPVQQIDNEAFETLVSRLRRALDEFKERFFDFSGSLMHLLQYTSHASVYMQHPSLETAVTAVLLALSCESHCDESGISLSIQQPYIEVNVETVTQTGLSVLRLWNDFVQHIPKLSALTPSLENDFTMLVAMLEDLLKEPGKKKPLMGPDQVLKTKQDFLEAASRFRAVEEQLTETFLKLCEPKQKEALFRLLRISRLSQTSGLNSAVAMFDLKGNAKLMEEVSRGEEDVGSVD